MFSCSPWWAAGASARGGTGGPVTGLDRALPVMTVWVVLPLALLSLASGVVQGLLTRWGLARHYWVVVKEVVTVAAVLVLLLQVPAVSDLGPTSAHKGTHGDLRTALVVHSLGGPHSARDDRARRGPPPDVA